MTGPGEGGRVDGVDVARGVAIVGMVMVHFGPTSPDGGGAAAWLYGTSHGKASVLFVLVAGIGTALLAPRREIGVVRTRMVYRAAWLIPLGLWLQTLDHNVAVILQYYGSYFILLALFITARARTVLVSAGALLAAGSTVLLAAHVHRPDVVVRLGGDPPGLLTDLLLLGYYPAATWLPPMLIGLWIGRQDLRAPATRRWLVTGGILTLALSTILGHILGVVATGPVSEASWWWLASTRAHSNMPLSVIGATGLAAAVVGICVAMAERWPRALWPMSAFGRLALTVYVVHLLLLPVIPDLLTASEVGRAAWIVLVFTSASCAFAVSWLVVASRGPLELAARWPWQRVLRPLVRRHVAPTASGTHRS